MARIRTIKPEFWTSEQVMDLSPNARLLFIGLWNFCDDAGIHPASLKRLKAELMPADDVRSDDVRRMIDECIKVGLLREYEIDGEAYWAVVIRQRLNDWRRERRIQNYSRDMLHAWGAGDKPEAMRLDRLRMADINSRSMSQVRRMEARMDFNVRRTIKRRVMDSFLRGRIPSSIVAAIFRLLRLRSL